MRKLEVIIRPERIDEIRAALDKKGIKGLTVTEVVGAGNQGGRPQTYRGHTFELLLLPKVKVEIVVDDRMVEDVVEVLCKAARTGEVGDGKIFIYPVEDVVRIRTGERGLAAV